MYRQVELYEEIEKVIDELGVRRDIEGRDGSEMEDVELAFLCGLIREKKPKKYLKLGFQQEERQRLF